MGCLGWDGVALASARQQVGQQADLVPEEGRQPLYPLYPLPLRLATAIQLRWEGFFWFLLLKVRTKLWSPRLPLNQVEIPCAPCGRVQPHAATGCSRLEASNPSRCPACLTLALSPLGPRCNALLTRMHVTEVHLAVMSLSVNAGERSRDTTNLLALRKLRS